MLHKQTTNQYCIIGLIGTCTTCQAIRESCTGMISSSQVVHDVFLFLFSRCSASMELQTPGYMFYCTHGQQLHCNYITIMKG